MTRRNLNREDGWVLVSAIVLMAIMLSIGLSAFAFVDTGQKRSRESRERESALSLAEASLYAQGFALAKNWPNGKTGAGLTTDCSSAAAVTASTLFCPDRNTLAKGSSSNPTVAQFTDVDFGADAVWDTKVRDNSGALSAAYDPAAADGALVDPVKGQCPQTPCRMDWNGDRQLWVQARANVRGRPRSIVARLKLEQLRESVPQAGLVSGSLDVTNDGNKVMLDGTGAGVIVRCADVTSSSCADYVAGKGQVTPPPMSVPAQPNFMTPSQLQRFKERALTDGTYFAGCPTSASELTGAVVWVERCDQQYAHIGPYSTPCIVPGSLAPNCINPTTSPGLLIWHCGTLAFTANSTFYGIVYMVNNSDSTCSGWSARNAACGPGTIYESSGGGGVLGALVVDGNACVAIGSNSLNLKFDANVFNSVTSYGTVGLVQNTWRELKAGS